MTTGRHLAISGRASVLLVDDEPALLATTEAILSEAYDVTTASSGEEAVALLQLRQFDVVCTDFSMGGALTGLDVIARAAAVSHHVGKILVTGQHEVGDGAGYYVLAKPCHPERLLDVVQRAAAQASSRRKLTTAAVEVKRHVGEIIKVTADKRSSAQHRRVEPPSAGVAPPVDGAPPHDKR